MQLIQQQHLLNNSYTAFADNEYEVFLEGLLEIASRGFFYDQICVFSVFSVKSVFTS